MFERVVSEMMDGGFVRRSEWGMRFLEWVEDGEEDRVLNMFVYELIGVMEREGVRNGFVVIWG